jgi:hypothetical protein
VLLEQDDRYVIDSSRKKRSKRVATRKNKKALGTAIAIHRGAGGQTSNKMSAVPDE